jgi:hypothetical protein
MAIGPQSTSDSRFSSIYPTPFFSVSDTYMPPTVKELFRWCRYFFLTDGTIQAVISKLSQYPITKIIYEGDEKSEQVYKEIFEQNLDIHTRLISIGMDYNVYGNCYIGFRPPVKRLGTCGTCRKTQGIQNFLKLQVKFNKRTSPRLNWVGLCVECKARGPMKVKDEVIKESDEFKLIFWDPLLVEIEHNAVSGRSKYIYSIPDILRNQIAGGHQDVLYDTPMSFIEASLSVESGGKIVMDKSRLFHFRRPAVTTDDTNRGYGLPLILPAMKLIYYMNILRRQQEAIAHEHIVPLRILHPLQTSAGMNPFQHANLPQWTGIIKNQVKKWRQDPNEFLITSVPAGIINVGGDARGLFVTPELQFTRRQIISSMDVPIEFVDGGLQWSGSSVSLRILENQFISYRSRVQRFIDWLIHQVSSHKGIEKVKVRMIDFKAADDVSRRNILVNLANANKLSRKTLYAELNMNYDEEQEAIKEEAISDAKNQSEVMKMQAQTQADITVAQQLANMEISKIIEQQTTPEPEMVEKTVKLLAVLSPESIQKIMSDMQRKNEAMYQAIYARLLGKEQPKEPQKDGVRQDAKAQAQQAQQQTQQQVEQQQSQQQQKPPKPIAPQTKELPSAKPPRRSDSPV